LDPFDASLPEEGNRAGFWKLEDKKSPPPKKKGNCVRESYTIVKAL
jgi:hypothetical protein